MTTVFLIDNGSLRPESTRNLRRVASRLGLRLDRKVWPVSLLHSNKVPPGDLDSAVAEVVEPALRERAERSLTDFLLIPFFFGPSRAITDYLPRRLARLKRTFPELSVKVAPPLVDLSVGNDPRIASILGQGVTKMWPAGRKSAVVVVDHGSPVPEVTAVRNFVAGQMSVLLNDRVGRIAAASMERRPGDRYRFNEPLLETLLDHPGFNSGPVVVSMMFLSPGRHAGPNGDVARICAEAEKRNPGLRTMMTPLAGENDGILDVLCDRVRDAEKAAYMRI